MIDARISGGRSISEHGPVVHPKRIKRFRGLAPVILGFVLLSPLGHSAVILSDLQRVYHGPDGYPAPTVQVTQSGWFAQEAIRDTGSLTLSLTPTASGMADGVGASLVSTVKWETRGGDQYPDERQQISGTSFDAVVSDFWVTRANTFNLAFTGLSVGLTYRLRTWHNDSYSTNEGFAAGGGVIIPTLSGATWVSGTNGAVTRLRGEQSDAVFGIVDLTFIPTISDPFVTYTRSGGSITAIPINGVELTKASSPIPETGTWVAMAVFAVGGVFVRARNRPASFFGPGSIREIADWLDRGIPPVPPFRSDPRAASGG